MTIEIYLQSNANVGLSSVSVNLTHSVPKISTGASGFSSVSANITRATRLPVASSAVSLVVDNAFHAQKKVKVTTVAAKSTVATILAGHRTRREGGTVTGLSVVLGNSLREQKKIKSNTNTPTSSVGVNMRVRASNPEDVYMHVSAAPTYNNDYDPATGKPGTWTVPVKAKTGSVSKTGTLIPTGTAAVKWGHYDATGNTPVGGLLLTSDLQYGPYIDIFTNTGGTTPWLPSAVVDRVRIGNLHGILGKSADEWGIAMGQDLSNTAKPRVEASNLGVNIFGAALTLWDSGGTARGMIDPTASGSTPMFWLGPSSADKRFAVSPDGSLTVAGTITANAGSIAGALTIGTSGGIYQGSGTFTSPTTGLKIFNSSGVGKISGYNAGTEQITLDTDGKLKAGAGSVVLSASGLSLLAGAGGSNAPGTLNFVNGSGTSEFTLDSQYSTGSGGLYDWTHISQNQLTAGHHSELYLRASTSDATQSLIQLVASRVGSTGTYNFSSDYTSLTSPWVQINNTYFTTAFSNLSSSACGEISSDTGSYKTLMILGNKSADGSTRRVDVWDRLNVNGTLLESGNRVYSPNNPQTSISGNQLSGAVYENAGGQRVYSPNNPQSSIAWSGVTSKPTQCAFVPMLPTITNVNASSIASGASMQVPVTSYGVPAAATFVLVTLYWYCATAGGYMFLQAWQNGGNYCSAVVQNLGQQQNTTAIVGIGTSSSIQVHMNAQNATQCSLYIQGYYIPISST